MYIGAHLEVGVLQHAGPFLWPMQGTNDFDGTAMIKCPERRKRLWMYAAMAAAEGAWDQQQ